MNVETDMKEHQEHLDRKNEARKQKADDKAHAEKDATFHCATFDLQKVLDTPSSEASCLYYK